MLMVPVAGAAAGGALSTEAVEGTTLLTVPVPGALLLAVPSRRRPSMAPRCSRCPCPARCRWRCPLDGGRRGHHAAHGCGAHARRAAAGVPVYVVLLEGGLLTGAFQI